MWAAIHNPAVILHMQAPIFWLDMSKFVQPGRIWLGWIVLLYMLNPVHNLQVIQVVVVWIAVLMVYVLARYEQVSSSFNQPTSLLP